MGAQAFSGNLNGGSNDVDTSGGSTHDRAFSLSWKIGPDGLLDWGRVRAANARLTASQLSDEKLRSEIARQVVESRTRVESLFEQMRLARRSMTAATETLRLTRERKELGVGTTQQELVRARSDYVSSVTELNQE